MMAGSGTNHVSLHIVVSHLVDGPILEDSQRLFDPRDIAWGGVDEQVDVFGCPGAATCDDRKPCRCRR